jgi:hypothetical protein
MRARPETGRPVARPIRTLSAPSTLQRTSTAQAPAVVIIVVLLSMRMAGATRDTSTTSRLVLETPNGLVAVSS